MNLPKPISRNARPLLITEELMQLILDVNRRFDYPWEEERLRSDWGLARGMLLLHLRLFREMSFDEIGEQLNMTRTLASSEFHRRGYQTIRKLRLNTHEH